jgi:hypothetical protein
MARRTLSLTTTIEPSISGSSRYVRFGSGGAGVVAGAAGASGEEVEVQAVAVAVGGSGGGGGTRDESTSIKRSDTSGAGFGTDRAIEAATVSVTGGNDTPA